VIIVHQDVVSTEDIEFLEQHHQVNMNIGAFAIFLDKYAEFNTGFVINSKKFYFVTLKPGNNQH